jgi:hypothetical protein
MSIYMKRYNLTARSYSNIIAIITSSCLILLSWSILSGCVVDNQCNTGNAVCPDNYESAFRILSKVDGKDLVFGSSAIFDKSKIRLFSITGTDTSYSLCEPMRLVMAGYDSVLHFKLSAKPAILFLQLSDNDIDSIKSSYGVTAGRCCSYNSISLLSYNDGAPQQNSNGTVEFRK